MSLATITRATLVPVAHLLFRPVVEGRENIPLTGPVIVAANHLSFIDSMIIPLMAPRVVSFMAKSEYFRRGRLTRPLFTGLGAIPIERAGFRTAQDSLETALELLKCGGAFGIHPEGSRSRDGRLYRGRTGVGWLAVASGAPVVPAALIGTDRVQPVGAPFPKPLKIGVRFGAPLTFIQSGGARARRQATDEIMAAIQALSGQEAAGVYNEPTGPETPG